MAKDKLESSDKQFNVTEVTHGDQLKGLSVMKA